VKKPRKKVAFPRRRWVINPVTRVKASRKTYERPRAKSEAKRQLNDE
jgi:hypothetical protein